MPAVLDTPETLSQQLTTVEITSHTVDHQTGAGVIVYDKGYVDAAGTFVPVLLSQVVDLDPLEIGAIVANANSIIAAQPTPDLYGAEKQALYEHLFSALGVTATIV